MPGRNEKKSPGSKKYFKNTSTSNRLRKGTTYGNQTLRSGRNIKYTRNNEEFEYVILSSPAWFELNGYNIDELESCWHGNPCGLTNKDKIGDNRTCVVTRGYGNGLFNNRYYPKGYCINTDSYKEDYTSDDIYYTSMETITGKQK